MNAQTVGASVNDDFQRIGRLRWVWEGYPLDLPVALSIGAAGLELTLPAPWLDLLHLLAAYRWGAPIRTRFDALGLTLGCLEYLGHMAAMGWTHAALELAIREDWRAMVQGVAALHPGDVRLPRATPG